MDLSKVSNFQFQVMEHPTQPSIRIQATFTDPAVDLETAWSDLRTQALAHPLLVGAVVVKGGESINGQFSPARTLNATITLARKPA